MKQAIATDLSQSRRLIACGVNPKSADMTWQEPITTSQKKTGGKVLVFKNPNHQDYVGDVPAWSLSSLLALLPKEIDIDGYTYRISIYFENPEEPIIGNHWCLYYKPKKRNERGRIDDITMYATDLIECAVLMVEYLTQNGYKLNEI